MTAMDTQLQVSTSGFFPSALAPSVRLQISCPRSCRGECSRFISLLVFLLNTGGVAVETDDRGPASRKLPVLVLAVKFLTSAVNGGFLFQGLLINRNSGTVLWYMTLTFSSVQQIEGKEYMIFRKMFDRDEQEKR